MSASLLPEKGKVAEPDKQHPLSAVRSMLDFGLPLLIGLFLWLIWIATARQVAVTVDNIPSTVWTHRATASSLMLDLGLETNGIDRAVPSAEALRVERARPFLIVADGRQFALRSWGETGIEVMADANLRTDQNDLLLVNGQPFGWDQALPAPVVTMRSVSTTRAWDRISVEALELSVERSVPIIIDRTMLEQGTLPLEMRTSAQTVGEALHNAEILIYEGDVVQPALASPVHAGMRIKIEQSLPVTIRVDDQVVKTRTRAKTVANALSELGFGLAGLDRVAPPLDAPLTQNLSIKITRIREEVEINEDVEPFETLFIPDPTVLIDTQQLTNPGAAGITRRRSRVRYEDGVEVSRVLEDKWIAQDPIPRTIAYGQKIVRQTYITQDGQSLAYWRKIRVIATSYSANTAGVPETVSWYGLSFSGDKMRKGIVAVDPRVIPLYSKTFVEGYGLGEALDKGSAIKGRRVDLGYDDWNLKLWNSWQDIYLLWPPPEVNKITWVLPNWPAVPE